MRLIGLDVTRAVRLCAADLDARPFGESEMARLLHAVLSAQMDAEEPVTGERIATLHDPCALFACCSLDLFRYEPKELHVAVVRVLDPLSLAVAMFVVIPVAGGAWMADIIERVSRSDTVPVGLSVLGGLALVPMLFGPVLVLGPLFVLVVLAAQWTPLRAGADRWWGQAAALTAYAAIVILSTRALLSDVTSIL